MAPAPLQTIRPLPSEFSNSGAKWPGRSSTLRVMQSPLAPQSAFEDTVALIKSGDLGAAEARCRAALEAYPRDINMMALLGALLVKMNRAAEAEQRLGETIALAPTFAKPHEDLGYLLVQENRPLEAVPYLERATHLDPTLEKAWFTLGKALAMLGRGTRSGPGVRTLFRALTRAPLHGAGRGTSEGGAARGSRDSLSAPSASRSTQCRCHAIAGAHRAQGGA